MNLSPLTRFRAVSPTASPLPVVDPRSAARGVRAAVRLHWRRGLDIALLLAVVAAALIFTGKNLFHYPQYELDEGTYVGSAWMMITDFKLFYYTYTYAHPPLGWLQIGLWSTFTGGFDRFGMSINSGRVFMLVLTGLGTWMVFLIVRRETARVSAAALAALVFATSPLAISLHRQVYLDNIGTFWLLVSIVALQSSNGRLGRITLSAAAFATAFLTKEVFAAMLPGMILLVIVKSHPLQRKFATVIWTLTAVGGMSFFVLLALLKDELLPPGKLWSSSKPHVSLITTYFHQAGRGGGGLLNPNGDFWKNAALWKTNDPVITLGGAAALVLCLLFVRSNRFTFGIAVIAAFFVMFLGRGGIVIYYYVIPLLPLMAIAIGLVSGHVINFFRRWKVTRSIAAPIALAAAILISGSAWSRNDLNFSVDDTSSQHLAAQWVVNNLSPTSNIIMDSYAWQDLHGTAFSDGHPFLLSNYYWPLLSDQGLVQKLLDDNWQKIDYLMISPNTQSDARSFNLPLLPEALSRSDVIRSFKTGNWTQKILRVRKLHRMLPTDDPMLERTWKGDKSRFIIQGRVIESANHQTTSQDQADAMLRAVYANDRPTFDAVWGWTKSHLQVRGDGLLASTWTGAAGARGNISVIDSTTEGDEDAALALLFASKMWTDSTYSNDAKTLLNGIWAQEVVPTVIGPILSAGSWAHGVTQAGTFKPTVSLAALAPYEYRIFADADPSHPWNQVVDSTYQLLSQIASSPEYGGTHGLAPDVVKLDATTGNLLLPGSTQAGTNTLTANGARLLWRLTVDYLWFKDPRAKTAINGLHMVRDMIKVNGSVASSYSVDGAPMSKDQSLSMYAAIVPSLLITDDPNLDVANSAFATHILQNYTDGPSGVYWGTNAKDYQAQTWSWMTTALMDGAISNIWAGQRLMNWSQILPQH